MSLPFRDRHDAGRQLGERVSAYMGRHVTVLGIPRGGVPVAYEVAHTLRAPLDIFLMRHLQAPGGDALLGAVASGGVRLLDTGLVERLHIPTRVLDEITQREQVALLARERTYRGQQAVLDVRGRVVILVDDGTTRAPVLREAAQVLAEHGPARIVIALPVAAPDVHAALDGIADDVICVLTAPPPFGPERWYLDFLPISHTEVRALLALSHAEAQSRELAASSVG